MSGAGDVNGDGFDDLIVGSPDEDNMNGRFPDDSGSARVFSGNDGSLLYTFDGGVRGLFLGASVSGAGDVNEDGFADVIVGGPSEGGFPEVRVFSGSDGSVIHNLSGSATLGWSVSRIGDVNGDLIPDLVAGDPLDNVIQDENGQIFPGSAQVFSGSDGSILYDLDGDVSTSSTFFGTSVNGVGDVNGDGINDFIVGSPGAHTAQVFSGNDGSVLYNLLGDVTANYFGTSVSGLGDVNGDGIDDFIVGAPHDSGTLFFLPGFGDVDGTVQVFSGSDGSVLYDLNGNDSSNNFGTSVSGLGDVNGDGIDDFIVGAPDETSDFGQPNNVIGTALVFSGNDGSVLYKLNGDSVGDNFGFSVSGAGDVNGDGIDDFIVGAFSGGANGGGYARVFVSQILGDANQDGDVNFSDIASFIAILAAGDFLGQADINEDSSVDFSDIGPFIELLSL